MFVELDVTWVFKVGSHQMPPSLIKGFNSWAISPRTPWLALAQSTLCEYVPPSWPANRHHLHAKGSSAPGGSAASPLAHHHPGNLQFSSLGWDGMETWRERNKVSYECKVQCRTRHENMGSYSPLTLHVSMSLWWKDCDNSEGSWWQQTQG